MAITLNKYAILCDERANAGGNMTPNTSSRMLLYEISKNWRELMKSSNFKSDRMRAYSEQEDMAGELLLSVLAYLHRIGCNDVERLLKEKLRQHSQISAVW